MERKQLTWRNSCCRKRGCPQVAFDGEFVYIRDDFGGMIKIKTTEFIGIHDIVLSETESIGS